MIGLPCILRGHCLLEMSDSYRLFENQVMIGSMKIRKLIMRETVHGFVAFYGGGAVDNFNPEGEYLF